MSTMIGSLQNSKIKELLKLKKTRTRLIDELFIIEGRQEIEMALTSGLMIEKIFYCPTLIKNLKLLEKFKQEIYQVEQSVFERISFRENPDGLIVVARPQYLSLQDINLNKDSLVLILEKMEKPGNIGAILRTADSSGVDAVIMAELHTDIYNHNVIRASLGTVFTNKVAVASNIETLDWLRRNNFKTIATTPRAEKIYYDCDYSGRIAILIGTEHDGLSELWLKNVEQLIRIPMLGRIDSLNASVSTAIITYEAVKQRSSTLG